MIIGREENRVKTGFFFSRNFDNIQLFLIRTIQIERRMKH